MSARVWSLRNWVRGSGSSSGFQSTSRSSRMGTKRFGGLLAAPRVGIEAASGVITGTIIHFPQNETARDGQAVNREDSLTQRGAEEGRGDFPWQRTALRKMAHFV